MNISQLTSDAKFSLAEKMSSRDLLSLCSTDMSMRQICLSNRFNPIWIKRLKEDYDIDHKGPSGYMEYLLATYTLKQNYYSVVIMNENTGEHEVIICRSREEGYVRILRYLNKVDDRPWSYLEVMLSIDSIGRIESNNESYILYLIEDTKFDVSPWEREKIEYETKLYNIATLLYPNDSDKQRHFIHAFVEVLLRDYASNNEGDLPTVESVIDWLREQDITIPNNLENLLGDLMGRNRFPVPPMPLPGHGPLPALLQDPFPFPNVAWPPGHGPLPALLPDQLPNIMYPPGQLPRYDPLPK